MAERANRSIVERARCMIFEAGLTKGFWAEAVSTAVYLLNRSPTQGHGVTPEEAWTGRKPNLSHVRIFGSAAMVHVPKQRRRKWDSKANECLLTGFEEETKGYRLYDTKAKRIIRSRDVNFINEGSPSSPSKVETKTLIQMNVEEVISLEPLADFPSDGESNQAGPSVSRVPNPGHEAVYPREKMPTISVEDDTDDE